MDLNPQDIDLLMECIRYSKQRVSDAAGTPNEVRKQNLIHLDAVAEKLRHMKETLHKGRSH
jgi:hypothetical protein